MTLTKNDSRNIAIKAARAGDSKKASPVRVFDLCGSSSLADFVVLLTVESAPQLDAVEEEISVQLKADNTYCLYRDGMRSKNWKVLDYGGVMVHVFDAKAEEFYSIGKLYGGHKPVQWEENAPARPEVKAADVKPDVVKPAAKKTPVKKAAAKKTAVKKAPVKKTAVKKAPAKKTAVKKTAAKKPAAKKAPAKKAAAKKTARKK